MAESNNPLEWAKRLSQSSPVLFAFVILAGLFLFYLDRWTDVAFKANNMGIEVLNRVEKSITMNTEILRLLVDETRAEQVRREREHESILQEMHLERKNGK